jgi:hypothetical protein
MKKTFLLAFCLFFLMNFSGQAQKQPVHKHKMFLSPDGKLYINKSLPLYLRISTSPSENAPSYLLHSEQTSKYSNPMYLDTEGKNTFRSPSAVDTITKEVVEPKEDIIYEVYADSKPPRTHLKFENGKKSMFEKDDKTYVSGDLIIVLISTDEMSGVEQILYSINGGEYTKYSEALHLSEEKEYLIKYYAVDNVGNIEQLQSRTFVIDKSAPKVSHKVTGDLYNNIISGRSRIVILAKDTVVGLSKLLFSVDSGEYKEYEYPISAAYLKQGEHSVKYYAIDNLQNKTDEQIYNFYVDKTPPVIVQEFIGRSFISNGREYASGKTMVKFTTFDNKAGIKSIYYSINDGAYQKYENPFYPADVKGDLTIRAYALDNVNNKSEDMGQRKIQSVSSFVDLTGPKLNYSFKGSVFKMDDTLFINNSTEIRLRGTDEESGLNHIDFKVDNTEYKTYDKPIRIESEGKHVIHFVGYDNVDNSSQESFLIVVDNTGPEISHQFSMVSRGTEQYDGMVLPKYPPFIMLFLSSVDKKVGLDKIMYSINGEKEKVYEGTLSNFKAIGKYFMKIKAFDKLGNESDEDIQFIISNNQ